MTQRRGMGTLASTVLLSTLLAGPAGLGAQETAFWLDLVGRNTLAEVLRDVVATPDGGVMGVGTIERDGVEWLWLTKRDADGLGERERLVDHPWLAGTAIVRAADGSFAVAANELFDDDAVVLRFGGPLGVHWSRRLAGGGDGRDELHDLAVTADGGFLAVGWTDSFDAPVWPLAWVVKLDGDGEVEWERILGEGFSGGLELRTVQPVADGGSIAVGDIDQARPWIVRLDAGGRIEWQVAAGDGGNSGGMYDVVPIDGGSGHAAVGIVPSGGGGLEAWVIALDDAGGLLWQRAFEVDGGGNFMEARLARIPAGLLVVADAAPDLAGSKLATLVLTERGELLDAKTYELDLPGFFSLGGVSGTPERGFFVGGGSWDYPVHTEAVLARVPAEGCIPDCLACLPLQVGSREPPEELETTFEPVAAVASQVTDFPVELVEIGFERRRICPLGPPPDGAVSPR